jgi:hypothetical protein
MRREGQTNRKTLALWDQCASNLSDFKRSSTGSEKDPSGVEAAEDIGAVKRAQKAAKVAVRMWDFIKPMGRQVFCRTARRVVFFAVKVLARVPEFATKRPCPEVARDAAKCSV